MLRLRGAGVRYGRRVVLEGVHLAIGRGSFVGVCGVSGSGKSTLGRLLTLHQDPTEGVRMWHQEDWTRRYGRQARSRVQLVVQDPGTSFPAGWSLRDILEEAARGGAPTGGRSAAALLEMVQLPTDWLGRTAFQLSGGQRRRLAIARALSVGPELLVLDESLTGLEAALQDELLSLLQLLQQETGIAVVLISHELHLLRKAAEQLVVLHEARVVEDGATESVWRSSKTETQRLIEASAWF